jgi:hypothetical protein
MGKLIATQIAASSSDDTFNVPTTDGSAGEFLKTDGSGGLTFASAAGGYHKVTVFTTSSAAGGYSPDTGVTKLVVEVQGAGGSSGNSTGSYGSSGSGAGGYAMKHLPVTSSDTMTVTIGAVTSTAAGGDSKFTTVTGASFVEVKGTGGSPGWAASGPHNGGDGGAGSGGDLEITGHMGSPNNANDSNMVGAGSMFGSGGITRSDGTTTGRTATGYGAGGSGSNQSTGNGGDGSPGLVIVWEYK